MSRQIYSVAAAALVLAASNVSTVHAQQNKIAAPGNTSMQASPHVQSMSELERAAQRLREAIQAMAQQAPGRDRANALKEADQALADVQTAMAEFGPPAPKSLPPRQAVKAATYDEAIAKLQHASDRLYDAIHTMARVPAGERRNAAMDEVNHALADTQVAIAWAADKKFTTASGATRSHAGGSTGSSTYH